MVSHHRRVGGVWVVGLRSEVGVQTDDGPIQWVCPQCAAIGVYSYFEAKDEYDLSGVCSEYRHKMEIPYLASWIANRSKHGWS